MLRDKEGNIREIKKFSYEDQKVPEFYHTLKGVVCSGL